MQREAQLAVTARLNDPRSAARTVAVELSGAFSASGKDMDAAYIEALRRGLAVLCGPAGADVATIVSLPGIALDIDNPADLAHFWQVGSRTRAGLWLARNAGALASAGFTPSPTPGTQPPP